MKKILKFLLVLSLILPQLVSAQQVCKTYITDEWTNSRYIVETIQGESIVTDTATKLVWKQCAEGLSGMDCLDGTDTTFLWNQALAAADNQNISGYAGFNDWRLPNIKELQTLSARNCYFPALNKTIFPNSPRYFWTSTPDDRDNDSVWVLDFKTGYDEKQLRDALLDVRLVRAGH